MSTPAWLRDLSGLSRWPQQERAHAPFGKLELNEGELAALSGIPAFINVQSAGAISQAHAIGARAISYLSFKDIYVHTDGYENGTGRVAWDPRKAAMLLVDWQGRFVNTLMDGTIRMWRYQVCNNTAEYRDAALAMVRRQMDGGADGVFVDNSYGREPCYGHGLPIGYSSVYRGVCAAVPVWDDPEQARTTPPEELYRQGVFPHCPSRDTRALAELPAHRHLHPDKSNEEAYGELLKSVRAMVKRYGEDKAVILNGGPENPFVGLSDACMLESYCCSWIHDTRAYDWEGLKTWARETRHIIDSGKTVIALSYLGHTGNPVEEDALYCAVSAHLNDYAWTDYGTGEGPFCAVLRRFDIGKRLTVNQRRDPCEYAFFENAVLVINPSRQAQCLDIPLPPGVRPDSVRDMLESHTIKAEHNAVALTVPADSARIFKLMAN